MSKAKWRVVGVPLPKQYELGSSVSEEQALKLATAALSRIRKSPPRMIREVPDRILIVAPNGDSKWFVPSTVSTRRAL